MRKGENLHYFDYFSLFWNICIYCLVKAIKGLSKSQLKFPIQNNPHKWTDCPLSNESNTSFCSLIRFNHFMCVCSLWNGNEWVTTAHKVVNRCFLQTGTNIINLKFSHPFCSIHMRCCFKFISAVPIHLNYENLKLELL